MIISTSRCILLDHAHIGDQHIPSFVDSIRLVLHDHEHVTLHNPRSCPHCRSTRPFLRWFNSHSTTWSWACYIAYSSIIPTLDINTSLLLSIQFSHHYMIMSMSCSILLDHAHIGDQHIPSFDDSIRLVLHDHEHVTLHTHRSCPHWRSTHPFLRRFDLHSFTWLWVRHVAYSSIMPTLEINTSIPS
jgi:glutaredoxin